MAGLSTYAQQKVLEHIVGKTSYTMPSTWLGLYTANPTDAGGGTETTYTSYVRKSTTGTDWGAASGTTITNAAALQFAQCTAGTATITAAGIFDASSAGNLLAWGTCSLSVSTGISPRFEIGTLTLTLD